MKIAIRGPMVFFASAFVFAACQRPAAADATPRPVATPIPAATPRPAAAEQWSGTQGGTETFQTRVVRTAEEWAAFWKQVSQEAPRPLDAAREMAVVVFAGGKRSGGFSVEIVRTFEQDGALVIEYREANPPPGAMVTMALTFPWAIITTPRSTLAPLARPVSPPPSAPREK